MTRILLFLCLFAQLPATGLPSLQAQVSYVTTLYNTSNGLPQQTVNAITQDRQGYIWLATANGFSRFDGTNFHNYHLEEQDSIPFINNQVRSIQEDSQGNIWLTNIEKHLFCFNPQNRTFITLPKQIRHIKYLRFLSNGGIWIHSADNSLVHAYYDAGKQLRYEKVKQWPREEDTTIRNISDDRNRHVWILTGTALWEYSIPARRLVKHVFGHSPDFRHMRKHGDDYLIADDEGRLYIYHKATNRFELHQLPTTDALVRIKSFCGNQYILNTLHNGFFLHDVTTGQSIHYHTAAPAEHRLYSNHIANTFVDKNSEMWVTYANCPVVTHIHPHNGTVRQYTMKDRNNRNLQSCKKLAVFEDRNKRLWFYANNRALNYYDKQKQQLVPLILPSTQNMPDFTEPSRYYVDRQRNIWLAKQDKGLLKITLKNESFSLLSPVDGDIFHSGNSLQASCRDLAGNLWVATQDSSLCVYDRTLRLVGYLSSQGTITQQKTAFGIVKALACDSQGRLWIGTDGDGLVLATPSLHTPYKKGNHTPCKDNSRTPYKDIKSTPYKRASYKLEHHCADPSRPFSLSSNHIACLYLDNCQRLWVGTNDQGINVMADDATGKARFIHAGNLLGHYPAEGYQRIRTLTQDASGCLWVATSKGLLTCPDPSAPAPKLRFHPAGAINTDQGPLPDRAVHHIYSARNGEMYFSTFGHGLFRQDTTAQDLRFKNYTTRHGLPTNVLYTLQEDSTGNMWIASEAGLCLFNPRKETFDTYDNRSFPSDITFTQSCSAQPTAHGLAFSTDRGLLTFSPAEVKKDGFVPQLMFTSFTTEGQALEDGAGHPLALQSGNKVELNHAQHSFNIHFICLDMNFPSRVQYAYRLEGFDDWNYTDDARAVYTNIPQGQYTFRVRSTNSDGVWVDNERVLHIRVLPSFWESAWGILLWVCILLTVISISTAIFLKVYQLKNKVHMERKLSEVKTTFFTNIVHEMRTPFTLIISPLENMLARRDLPADVRHNLEIMQQNTGHTLKLINQILDFQKIKSNKMHLQVRTIELRGFLNHLLESFASLAESHRTTLRLQMEPNELRIWADEDKLESIFFNLLSNAFKYSPRGTTISVGVEEEPNGVVFRVSDQGYGIPPEKQSQLFNRFETFLQKHSLRTSSTGIGLSLVKELINLHKGSIGVESRLNEGTTFVIHLPKGRRHFAPGTEFILNDQPEPAAEAPATAHDTPVPDGPETNDTADSSHPVVLVVEDNTELRGFLQDTFTGHYTVLTAVNGREGFRLAMEHTPDLIVSDVNMPLCTGTEMACLLREQMATSHIPIILLTSRASVESQIESLENGVDAYVTKPFSTRLLQARIDSLLLKRRQLQTYYQSLITPSAGTGTQAERPQPDMQLSPANREWLDCVTHYIEKHLGSSELSVDTLARHMHMSRTVFFKKLKALIGLSPIELIRNLRLQEAMRLMRDTDSNLTEIAFDCGFYDSHHFSKAFKQIYNRTPSEYRKQFRAQA